MADAEMRSVDPMEAKLTQCEREYFLLISAANRSEWPPDPLDEVGDATGPLRGGVAREAIVPDVAGTSGSPKHVQISDVCGDGRPSSKMNT